MKHSIMILIIGIIFQSCMPKVRSALSDMKYEPIEEGREIFIIGLGEEVPENSNYVGELKVGDSGFSTDCGYEKVTEEAKDVARKSGSNLILLTEIKEPNFGSTCYRIRAKMYRNFDNESLTAIAEKRALVNKSRLPVDADYAIIHFYRPWNYSGSLIGFKIRDNRKTVIGRVRNGEKFEFKITEFGKHKFWAKTESEASIEIDIEKGQEYFVRCGIKMGVTVGRPEMYVVENYQGIAEIEKMK